MANKTLESAISDLYPNQNISEQDLIEIADKLIKFFAILIEEKEFQKLAKPQ